MKLHLNFLGKDSVTYDNTIEIDDEAAQVLLELQKGKSKSDKIFSVGEGELNDFLRESGIDITAKVFRTSYGTKILIDELKQAKLTGNETQDQLKAIYNNAALAVAKKLNHQKAVSKNYDDQEKKAKDKIKDAKNSLEERKEKIKEQLAKIEEQKAKLKDNKKLDSKTRKEKLKALNERQDKLKVSLEKAKLRVEKAKSDLDFKKKTKNFAIGTAKSAYSSPEVCASWCAKTGMEPAKVYSKSLLEKYSWAFEDPDVTLLE